eukprot:c20451_g1_i1 orf=125-1213(+)
MYGNAIKGARDIPGTSLPRLNPISGLQKVASLKRPLEADFEDGAGAVKRHAASREIIFRLLVSSRRVGKIIGKEGARIRNLREETGAQITITDASKTFEDRVIMISSKEEDAIGLRSAAEDALLQLATLVVEENGGDNMSAKGAQHQGTTNLIRLLIGRSQAGCLIGKGGATINDIRESTEANVRILPSDQLPMCIWVSHTDRLVQISGQLIQVLKALEIIASRLRENPSKEAITLKPNYFFRPQQLPYSEAAYPGFTGHQFRNGRNIVDTEAALYGDLNLKTAIAPLVQVVNVEMSIPSVLIGGVIGKGGAKITQIRTTTGCAVKVFNQEEGEKERKIAFKGTAEQVFSAQRLVQAFMSAQ